MDHFKRRGWPWLLVVPDRWVAPGRQDQISGLLDSLGFHLAMNSPVVTADKLRDPEESPLEIRSVGDENDWAAIASVNAEGWGVPAAWVLPLLASEKFQSEARGWIGWFDGQPVCATVTFPALDFTYCAWGATIPAYRKHGFASQTLRYAAVQAGRNRPVFAVLGPSGLRTYRDAGFVTREHFRLYLAPG